jgi:hypothetical protein
MIMSQPLPSCNIALSQLDTLAAPIRWQRPTKYFVPFENDLWDNGIAAYLGPTATAIHSYLRRKANRDSQCWPSVPTIAAYVGVSDATVRRHLPVIRDCGLMSYEEREVDGRTENDSNLYTLHPLSSFRVPEQNDSTCNQKNIERLQKVQSKCAAKKTQSVSLKEKTGNKARETQKAPAPVVAESILSNDSTTQSTLMARMLEIGINPNVAARLESTTDAKVLCEQLDCLSDREPRDPAAVLVKATREGWEPPAKYLERIQAARRIETERDERRATITAAQRQKALDEQKNAALEVERQRLDMTWQTLDAITQQRITATAIERLGLMGRLGKCTAALDAMKRVVLGEMMGETQ